MSEATPEAPKSAQPTSSPGAVGEAAARPAPETVGLAAWWRRTYRMAALMLYTSWCVVVGQITARLPWLGFVHYDQVQLYKRNWAWGARIILDVRPTVVRSPVLPTPDGPLPRGRLVVANHRSPLDVIAVMRLFGGHFLANHKTRTAPVIGYAAYCVGTLFVDRDDPKSGAQAVRAMRKLLQEKRTVVVFPEGTTFAGDEVRPFKGGAFVAASGLDVEVVPVGLAYPPGMELAAPESIGQHGKRFLSRPFSPVTMVVGEPFDFPAKRKGVEDDLRDRVQALVDEARRASRA